jgi:AcrR family transcriptional regulator
VTVTVPARRRDAQLNRAQILSVALRELNADPDVSIEEIAKAAGVVRRTVYGHFPSREALLDALAETVAADVADLADEACFTKGDPTLTLARFTLAVWRLRERYRSFPVVARRAASGGPRGQLDDVRARVAALLERGQHNGQFGTDVAPRALARMVEWLMLGAIEAAAEGAVDDATGGRAAVLVTLRAVGATRKDAERAVERAFREARD